MRTPHWKSNAKRGFPVVVVQRSKCKQPALERLGFCFAAWLPDFAADSEVLRLQHVGSHPVDVEHVVCARPEGERVRDYVVNDWHRVRRGGVA